MIYKRLPIWIGCLMVCGLGLAGCAANLFTYEGRSVAETNLIALDQSNGQSTWQSKDVTIDYEFSKSNGQLSISGTARLSNHLIYSFNSIKRFNLQLNFADAAKTVLATHGLVTLARRDSDRPIKFNQVLVIPTSATYMVFSYRGSMYDSGADMAGATWDFWKHP